MLCTCRASWTSTGCNGTQVGCPAVACDGDVKGPWCLVETAGCLQSQGKLGHYFYCVESPPLQPPLSPSPPAPPPSPPPSSPVTWWTIVSGAEHCALADRQRCITTGEGYGDQESCEVRAELALTVSATYFEVEAGFDYVAIEGVRYTGNLRPENVSMAAGSILQWRTNFKDSLLGWTLCADRAHGPQPPSVPPSPPSPPQLPSPPSLPPAPPMAPARSIDVTSCAAAIWQVGILSGGYYSIQTPVGGCGAHHSHFPVWGSNPYMAPSSFALALQHFTPYQPGDRLHLYVLGYADFVDSYESSTRNGVTTLSASWSVQSFTLSFFTLPHSPPIPPRSPPSPAAPPLGPSPPTTPPPVVYLMELASCDVAILQSGIDRAGLWRITTPATACLTQLVRPPLPPSALLCLHPLTHRRTLWTAGDREQSVS